MKITVLRKKNRTLYTELTQLLHSTLPALLPNQVLPYADYHFFNKTPEELPTNSYGSIASKRVPTICLGAIGQNTSCRNPMSS